MRSSFAGLALVLLVAGFSTPEAAAQSGCTEINAQGYRTCLLVNERPQVGETIVIEAYSEWPSQFQVFDTNIAIYLGENEIFNGRVDPITRRARVEVTFYLPGNPQVLRALPGRGPVSNNVTVTPVQYSTSHTAAVSAATSEVGGKITLNTTTRLYKPSGIIAFYVLPPGGTQWTIFGQKAANSMNPQYLDTDSREFSFNGPYNKPGLYRFTVGYLGDPLNFATLWAPYQNVQVMPFDVRKLLPVLNLLLGD